MRGIDHWQLAGHGRGMRHATTTFKMTVPNARFKKANAVLEKLGLSAGDAFNLMLAQIEIQKGLPFHVSLQPQTLLTAEAQAEEWTKAYGAY
jgi:addiction module RelB/DinJ family antitoxin